MADNRSGLEGMIRSRRSPRRRVEAAPEFDEDLETREYPEPAEEAERFGTDGYRVGSVLHLLRDDPMSRFLRSRLR